MDAIKILSNKDIEHRLEKLNIKTGRDRIRSVDIARGFIIAISAFLSHIPPGGYPLFRHAEWYGLTILDLIFPAFLTLFGTSMAIAYDRQIKWQRVIRRTFLLILIGLIYNVIVSWSFDLSTLRITGVLQLYAVVGLIVVLLTAVSRVWWVLTSIAIVVLISYGWLLSSFGTTCPGGLPQPDCNLSGIVDTVLFGENHIYAQGSKGYDPEGVFSMLGAMTNVLFGYAAGRILLSRRKHGACLPLLGYASGLILLTPLLLSFVPLNKRLWTPGFAVLTAGITIVILAVCFWLTDQSREQTTKNSRLSFSCFWVLEALGRNGLLVYFGKYMLASITINIAIETAQGELSIREWLLGLIPALGIDPKLVYAALMFTFWVSLASWLHKKGWYIRV